MQYLISFLEGVITFISPCLLPMLPIYVSYFAGNGEENYRSSLWNALGFVTGFTVLFVAMGMFAGAIGSLLMRYQTVINIITGLVVVFFGLVFLDVFKLKLFSGLKINGLKKQKLGFFPSLLFGIIFSVSWTPCVGVFLGSALLLASRQASMVQGIFMLFAYSLGLGIPFILSAVLIEKLKASFQFIKKNYRVIHMIAGIFLVLIGILMMTGSLGTFLSAL